MIGRASEVSDGRSQPSAPGPHALADFVGTWRVARRIAPADGAAPSVFDGQAVLTPTDGALDYAETGELAIPGQARFSARQSYVWRADAGGVAVHFPDGRPFHTFAFTGGAGLRHDCPPDLYLGTYDFRPWPDWHVTWRVSGPRKAYTSQTIYRRV